MDAETVLYIDINVDKRFYDTDLGKEDCTQGFGGKASRKAQVAFHNKLMVSVKSHIKGVTLVPIQNSGQSYNVGHFEVS